MDLSVLLVNSVCIIFSVASQDRLLFGCEFISIIVMAINESPFELFGCLMVFLGVRLSPSLRILLIIAGLLICIF